eukprot:TRINITY_DN20471_c0_g1_i6.p1 TRINITY_DN20471_c0_g1~~TRINITY_DN20471_c0_g1_i6.p1  ORF type:complete len:626 (-),score=38.21 TRINITY_DN20471_c0_g1_i6:188-2065(-)
MDWDLPPLPSPFGFAYHIYRHGAPSWDALLVHPEGPFLPKCEESEWHSYSTPGGRSRMMYWLSWYFLVAIITVFLCYGAHVAQRVLYLRFRHRTQSYRQLEGFESEAAADMMESQKTEVDDARSPELGEVLKPRGRLDGMFPILHLGYHAFCVIVVLVGWQHDALCPGPGLDWELWAVWQMGMSLSCIVQAAIRNSSGTMSAHPRTHLSPFVQPAITWIVPGLSEPMDTMKDWVVTGMCFRMLSQNQVSPFISAGFAAFLIGVDNIVAAILSWPINAYIVNGKLADAISRSRAFVEPERVDARSDTQPMIPIATLMPITCFTPVFVMYAVSMVLDKVFLGALLDLWAICGNAVCLGILSAYSIVISHRVVYSRADFTYDLRKSYLSVLSLPEPKPKPLIAEQQRTTTWLSGFQGKIVAVTQDATSNARLAIAWNEDLSQGFLGVFFAWRRGALSGFAFISGVVSLAKALGIPTVRLGLAYLKFSHFHSVEQEVTATIDPLLKEWTRELGRSDEVERLGIKVWTEKTGDKWTEMSTFLDQSLADFLVLEFDTYAPIQKAAAALQSRIQNELLDTMSRPLASLFNATRDDTTKNILDSCRSIWTQKPESSDIVSVCRNQRIPNSTEH